MPGIRDSDNHPYHRELRDSKVLSHDEILELFEALRRNDRTAEEKIVSANLKFVYSVANKYRDRGMEFSDLLSEGNRGLLRAIKDYDPSRGIKFLSYAVYWIRQRIESALDDNQTVRIPQNIKVKEKKVLRLFGRNVTLREIEENFDFGEDNSRYVFESICQRHSSLDTPVASSEDGTRTLMDTLADDREQDVGEMTEVRDELTSALGVLTPIEEKVIKDLYPLENEGNIELYLTDVSKMLGLPVERIRNVKKRALEKLRKEINRQRQS